MMQSDTEFAAELARRLNVLIGARMPEPGATDASATFGAEWAMVQTFAVVLMQCVDGSPLAAHPTVVASAHPLASDDAPAPGEKWVGLIGLLNGLCGEAMIIGHRNKASELVVFEGLKDRSRLGTDGVVAVVKP